MLVADLSKAAPAARYYALTDAVLHLDTLVDRVVSCDGKKNSSWSCVSLLPILSDTGKSNVSAEVPFAWLSCYSPCGTDYNDTCITDRKVNMGALCA